VSEVGSRKFVSELRDGSVRYVVECILLTGSEQEYDSRTRIIADKESRRRDESKRLEQAEDAVELGHG